MTKKIHPAAGSATLDVQAGRDGASALADALRPGQSIALLQELHILTRDGRLNQDSRRKLKQVNHLYQFIEKLLLELCSEVASSAQPAAGDTSLGACRAWGAESVLEERRSQNRPQRGHFLPDLQAHSPAMGQKAGVLEERRSQKWTAAVGLQPATPKSDRLLGLTVADHGAGKSYLGFILYDLFFRQRGDGWIYGIETRPELVEKSRLLAARLGFARMSFLNLSVAESTGADEMPPRIDLVTALHACDTATDDAIAFGLAKSARAMVLVPCCQAELARLLNAGKALSLRRTPLAELWRHPLHTRELGSQLSNVLRCLYLEAWGYQVTVTELVGWEHSMKNELIIARHTGLLRRSAAQRMRELLAQFGLEPLLQNRYRLPFEAVIPGAAG